MARVAEIIPADVAALVAVLTDLDELTSAQVVDESSTSAGLEHAGRLDADCAIHVDVLKVQHHGAESDITLEFCRRVTADHYVFCGNGAHHNGVPTTSLREATLGVSRRDAPGGGRCGMRAGPAVRCDNAYHLTFGASHLSSR